MQLDVIRRTIAILLLSFWLGRTGEDARAYTYEHC
jgi:hypothetical protein